MTAELAEDLLMDTPSWMKIGDLLWERKQVIFYGPPGTGKTYLASKLARHLTEDGAVKLVQFHPSYTYEDFFEGFRPEPGGSGTLTFTLRAGPFRDFAEVAAANPSTAYILIIDEINRANLAKVFGELYFLLEYRDQSISLQYSPDKEFVLPENLFLIGTMNTADRSIARIDTAMRRRFAFVELDPSIPPVQGLLARWLTEQQLPLNAARLLDELNGRIEDADAAIGPSYLMKEAIYRRDDGLERVWQYDIMPLLEDLFYGQRDLAEHYGLPSLRKAIASAPTTRTVISVELDELGPRVELPLTWSRDGRWPTRASSSPRRRPTTRESGWSGRPGRSARPGSAKSRSTSSRRSTSPGCCSSSATPSTPPRGSRRRSLWRRPRISSPSSRRRCGGRPNERSIRACFLVTSSSRRVPRFCAVGCVRASSCVATTGCRSRWRSATTSSRRTSRRTGSCAPPASECLPSRV